MIDIWWFLFLGHLMGDYIFQTDAMARDKAKKGWVGIKACTIHCIEYSLVVCATLFLSDCISWPMALIFFPIVFLTHFPIDRVSFGKWWLKNYNRKELPNETVTIENISGFALYWIVYIAVDNTFHFVLMTIGLGLLMYI